MAIVFIDQIGHKKIFTSADEDYKGKIWIIGE